MKNFIIQQWPSIVIIAAFIIWVGYLVVKRKWDQLRSMAYQMILQAERVIVGTNRGQERFETVFQEIYNMIPAWLRFWFPDYLLREKLQEWYNLIKDYLDDGKIDGSTNS
jgi:hypothetical protein